MRDYVTRGEYDAWINECVSLAVACGYPVQDSMIHDDSGYRHEPTEAGKDTLLPEWQHIHDNAFMHPGVAEGRLANHIREA